MSSARFTFALAAALAEVFADVPHTVAEPLASPTTLVDAHLLAREDALGKQHDAALHLVRQHAWVAYRLGRRRALGFFADSKLRPEEARAEVMAVVVLGRSLHEARKLQDELKRLQQERTGLAAREAQDKAAVLTPVAEATVSKPLVLWPTKGPTISSPGLRPDPVTGVVYRDPGLQILARLDAPVVSPAAGVVRKVAALPNGGYAVVLAHDDELVSILSGLHTVDVAEGEPVQAGVALGRVGRTLDGAPVLRLAVWRAGVPVDARGLRAPR